VNPVSQSIAFLKNAWVIPEFCALFAGLFLGLALAFLLKGLLHKRRYKALLRLEGQGSNPENLQPAYIKNGKRKIRSGNLHLGLVGIFASCALAVFLPGSENLDFTQLLSGSSVVLFFLALGLSMVCVLIYAPLGILPFILYFGALPAFQGLTFAWDAYPEYSLQPEQIQNGDPDYRDFLWAFRFIDSSGDDEARWFIYPLKNSLAKNWQGLGFQSSNDGKQLAGGYLFEGPVYSLKSEADKKGLDLELSYIWTPRELRPFLAPCYISLRPENLVLPEIPAFLVQDYFTFTLNLEPRTSLSDGYALNPEGFLAWIDIRGLESK